MRFYCTSTGPIGGLNCEVLLYFNWSPIGGLSCEAQLYLSVPLETLKLCLLDLILAYQILL